MRMKNYLSSYERPIPKGKLQELYLLLSGWGLSICDRISNQTVSYF